MVTLGSLGSSADPKRMQRPNVSQIFEYFGSLYPRYRCTQILSLIFWRPQILFSILGTPIMFLNDLNLSIVIFLSF